VKGRLSFVGGVSLDYTKPHKSYRDQLQILTERGLFIENPAKATRDLKRIGYYRLSAYTYPFREKQNGPGRADNFVPGVTFEDAVALCDFDDRLRITLLSGLQHLEIGLRVQVGYQLGKSGPFSHLDRKLLDATRTKKLKPEYGTNDKADAYEAWRQRYDALQIEAKSEDYVKHFILKYDSKIPIWVATEFMTFGNLVALYDLLTDKDALVIAREYGILNRNILHGWLRALNILRNQCAHNSRIWNRATVFPPSKPNGNFLPPGLKHLALADNTRLYYLAAILAHLLLAIEPDSRWPSDFKNNDEEIPLD